MNCPEREQSSAFLDDWSILGLWLLLECYHCSEGGKPLFLWQATGHEHDFARNWAHSLQPCKDSRRESWTPSNPTSLQLWTVTKTEKSKNSFWKMAPLSNEMLLHSVTRSLLWWLCVLLWRTRHRECWLWHLESYGFLQGLWLGGPCGFTGEQGVRQHCFLSSEEHAKDVLLMMPALQRPISTDCPTGLSQVMARNWSLFISWCLQDSSLQQHSI